MESETRRRLGAMPKHTNTCALSDLAIQPSLRVCPHNSAFVEVLNPTYHTTITIGFFI